MPIQYRIQGGPPRTVSPLIGCLPFFALLLMMCLLPVFLFDVGQSALEKLGLSSGVAGLAIAGIFLGSLVNIPVYELHKDELQPEVPYGPLGIALPRTFRRVQQRTSIAVNLGGCVIPLGLAIGQALRLVRFGEGAFVTAGIVCAVSIFVCWRSARPMEGIGILMPGLIPPLVSVLTTWLLLSQGTPEQRAATAFIAGVVGPVVGADLLHLRDLTKTPVAMMSIGGAGTFDGIVLSGILAALLA